MDCKLIVLAAVMAGGISGAAAKASASEGQSLGDPAALSLSASASASQPMDKREASALDEPTYLDAAPTAPNIHGFAAVTVTSAYVTPRGVVVENQGIVVQPIVGLVFPLGDIGFMKKATIVAGIWNNLTYHQNDPKVGAWNEMDIFVDYGFNITDKLKLDITYGAWNYPESTVIKPSTQHNLDFKFAYDDSDMLIKGFAIHPYVDLWYAIYGSSTVVVGDEGDTGYVEIGIAPTFKTGIVTWTFPTYFSVGPKGYWDDKGTYGGGNFGVLSAAVDAGVPLSFIPVQYGYWHADVGMQYYYLLNDALLEGGHILSGNDDRNVFRGFVGLGVNF